MSDLFNAITHTAEWAELAFAIALFCFVGAMLVGAYIQSHERD